MTKIKVEWWRWLMKMFQDHVTEGKTWQPPLHCAISTRTDLPCQVFEHLYQWKIRLKNMCKTALFSFLVCINNSIQFSFSSFKLLRMPSLAIQQQQSSVRVTTQFPCKQSNNLRLSKCNHSIEKQELSAGKFHIIILLLSNMYIVKSSDAHKHHYPHHTQLFH